MAWNNAAGTYFVSADMKGIIKVWDYSQACIKQFQGHKGEAPLHPFHPLFASAPLSLPWSSLARTGALPIAVALAAQSRVDVAAVSPVPAQMWQR